MEVRVLVGDAAMAAMERPDYRVEWRALYEACPWATSTQSPECTALRCAARWAAAEPVIVEGRRDGALVGLLALARPRSGTSATSACGEDGDYSPWIADAAHAESFMPTALAALWSGTTLTELRLQLPARAPLAWARRGPWRRRCRLVPSRTYVMRLDDPERLRRFVNSKQSLRASRNQLRRLGPLTFRKVVGKAEFERVLDRFAEMHAARKHVRAALSPFEYDEFKRPYLVARQLAPGMQHTTVLESGGRIIAAHIGLAARPGGTFCLAGIAHDGHYDKYSPGSQLLAHLIPMLCEEGYSEFDLTPGGAAYKARWGDSVETVYELHAFPSVLGRVASAGRELCRRVARRFEPLAARRGPRVGVSRTGAGEWVWRGVMTWDRARSA